MEENIKGLLATELRSEIQKLSDLEPGTEEHKSAVEAVAKLSDRYSELLKIDNEQFAKDVTLKHEDEKLKLEQNKLAFEKRKFENEMKEKLESRKEEHQYKLKQRFIDWVFKGIELGIPLVTLFAGFKMKDKWFKESIIFEQTGTITTSAGKANQNSLFR